MRTRTRRSTPTPTPTITITTTTTITTTMTTTTSDPLALDQAGLLRLLHLASPALPIGAFAYSQGLEHAVEVGWVSDERAAADWIVGLLGHALGALEVPVYARLH